MKFVSGRWRPINICKNYLLGISRKTVLSGPFAGMKYIGQSVGSAYFPKILGTYEKELHDELGINQGKFLVVGAGEGYYAVGLAFRFRGVVTAYEQEAKGREFLRQLAELNGYGNQIINKGTCTPNELMKSEREFDLGLMDIEGEERTFLLAGVFEHFKNTRWIIELHSSDMEGEFRARLSGIFEIRFLKTKQRTMTDYPIRLPLYLRWVFSRYWKSLLQEWRTDSTGWLILTPRSS